MPYLPMKRGREGEIRYDLTTMASYLMNFSMGAHHDSFHSIKKANNNVVSPGQFECKTCNRQFASFQALGGHRASHKRQRVMGGDLTNHQSDDPSSPAKSKSHECSICGLEFAVGQALGGHMRRHRSAILSGNQSPNLSIDLIQQVQVAKKGNDQMKVFGLDLNLTPLENDLEFEIQNMAPKLVELCL